MLRGFMASLRRCSGAFLLLCSQICARDRMFATMQLVLAASPPPATRRLAPRTNTGPHLRRDWPTSAPGLAHICAGITGAAGLARWERRWLVAADPMARGTGQAAAAAVPRRTVRAGVCVTASARIHVCMHARMRVTGACVRSKRCRRRRPPQRCSASCATCGTTAASTRAAMPSRSTRRTLRSATVTAAMLRTCRSV